MQFWLIPREKNEADPYAKAGTFEDKSGSIESEIPAVDFDMGRHWR